MLSLLRSMDGLGKTPPELDGRVGGDGGAWPPKGSVCTLLGATTGCSQRYEAVGILSFDRSDRCSNLPRGNENLE